MTTATPGTVAVLDASVLYPPSLRDLLMRLAVVRAYEPRWTEEIHAEWTRNVLADYPDVTPAQLDRTRRLMNQAIPKVPAMRRASPPSACRMRTTAMC
jgi:hypothetical protein